MSEKPPFQVGDRVRMKAHIRPFFGRPAVKYVGVVTHCLPSLNPGVVESHWRVRVKRIDGRVSNTKADCWELIPPTPLTLDQTAQSLADAVKAGDTNAALLLADRVMELCGATRT